MLSISFQQAARYVYEYPEEVTSKEAEISRAVIDYDHIAELHNPGVSDFVKGAYMGDSEVLPSYFAVWMRRGLRHPKAYIEATIANSYKRWYPETRPLSENAIAMGVQIDDRDFLMRFMGRLEKAFDWHGCQTEETREARFDAVDAVSKLSIVNALCNMASVVGYCWWC